MKRYNISLTEGTHDAGAAKAKLSPFRSFSAYIENLIKKDIEDTKFLSNHN